MPRGTPEQSKLLRRRRRVVSAYVTGGGLVWLGATYWIGEAFGKTAELVFMYGFLLLLVLGLIGLSFKYFVCPVCRQPFRHGSIGRKCENCGATFDG